MVAIAAGVCDVVFAKMKEVAVWFFTSVVKGTNLGSKDRRYHQGLISHVREHNRIISLYVLKVKYIRSFFLSKTVCQQQKGQKSRIF